MDALEMGLKASTNAAKEVVKAFDNGLLGVKRFNFKSQICTTREQSERLLSLGLKKETADMCWIPLNDGRCVIGISAEIKLDIIPAWSLHRLIEMVSKTQYPYYVISKTLPIYDALCERIEWLIEDGYFPKEYLEE
jgi:hypothetical protein